jgi:hypothetical protein
LIELLFGAEHAQKVAGTDGRKIAFNSVKFPNVEEKTASVEWELTEEMSRNRGLTRFRFLA